MGIRAGSPAPKQFVSLAGRSLIEWTLGRIMDFPEVSGAVVALPREFVGAGSNPVAQAFNLEKLRRAAKGKPLEIVAGGATRQESVFNALKEVPRPVNWVMVHDASRPLLSRDLFLRVFRAALSHSAAIPGLVVTDTMKSVIHHSGLASGESLVEKTLRREDIVTVQTPQVFRSDLLRVAHERARAEGFAGTDDSQLVERLGYAVVVVPGERLNMKLTFPEDFRIFEIILASQSREVPQVKGLHDASREPSLRWKWRRRSGRPILSLLPVTGLGFDVHRFGPGRKCIIGGTEIPFPLGLLGHSDADVLCHAIMDGILGALSLGDIGRWFPPDDPAYEGSNSLNLLRILWERLKHRALLVHLDCTIVAEAPRIMPYAGSIRGNLSRVLGVNVEAISLKATTPEGLGSLGRGEGVAALALVTLVPKGRSIYGS